MANIRKNVRKTAGQQDMPLNVGFLKGSQANLNSLIENVKNQTTTYRPGAFYLTHDTNRLYFAHTENQLECLNQNIRFLNSQADLTNLTPYDGDIAYIKEGNILAVYDATDDNDHLGKWVQINAYTNTDTNTVIDVDGVSLDANVITGATDGTEDQIELKIGIQTTDIDETTGNAIPDTTTQFETTASIKKTDLDAWYNKSAVGAEASINGEAIQISTVGEGNDADKVATIYAGDNITITNGGTTENPKVTINSQNTTYALDATEDDKGKVAINLTGTETSGDGNNIQAGTIGLIGDNNDIEIELNENDDIVVKHKTGYLTNEAAKDATTYLVPGDTFTAVNGINTSNGHIVSIHNTTFELPEISDVKLLEDGKIQIQYADQDNNALTDSYVTGSTALGYYVTDNNDTKFIGLTGTEKQENGDYKYNNLSDYFYTKNDINTKLDQHFNALNALTYKGVLTSESLPTTASIGDVYIIGSGATGITIGDESTSIGDMIIANGTETDGVITGDITWELIPGTELDTQYELQARTTEDEKTVLTLAEKTEDGNTYNVEFTSTGPVSVSATDNVINVAHDTSVITTNEAKSANEAPSLVESDSFVYVKEVKFDDYGHANEISYERCKLPGSHSLSLDNGVVNLLNSQKNSQGSFTITKPEDVKDEDNKIVINSSSDENNNITYTVKHAEVEIATSASENPEDLLNGCSDATNENYATQGVFTVVTNIGADSTGHLTQVDTKTYRLPVEKQYSLNGTVATDNKITTVTTNLIDETNGGNNVGSVEVQFKSNTLTINATSTTDENNKVNNVVAVELMWESF